MYVWIFIGVFVSKFDCLGLYMLPLRQCEKSFTFYLRMWCEQMDVGATKLDTCDDDQSQREDPRKTHESFETFYELCVVNVVGIEVEEQSLN